MGQKKRPQQIIGTGLALVLLGSSSAQANVCDDVKNQQGAAATQKQELCQAAEASRKAAKADKVLAGVWGAVTVVCAAACAPIGWASGGGACTAASVGGTVVDMATTKNFASSLSSLMGVGMGLAMNDFKWQSPEGGNKANKMACFAAASAALQSFTKAQAAKQQQSSADANWRNARDLNDNAGKSGTVIGGFGKASGGTGGGMGSKFTGATGGSPLANEDDKIASACARAEGSALLQAHVECAVGSDSNLGFIANPRFQDDFKDVTGKNLGDFLANADDPASAIMGALGPGLQPSQARELASALQGAKETLPFDTPGSALASRGGGARKGSSNDGDDMAQLMAGLMSQLMPKGESEEPPSGFSTMDFKSLTRSPSAVAEDRSINIFQRVSFRYHYVGRRVLSGGASR